MDVTQELNRCNNIIAATNDVISECSRLQEIYPADKSLVISRIGFEKILKELNVEKLRLEGLGDGIGKKS